MSFADRREAGRELGAALRRCDLDEPLILALPRGGVPVGAEVARILDAPLDLIVVRKLTVPARPELALGAVGEGGVVVHNDEVIAAVGVSAGELAEVERRTVAELDRQAQRLRGDRAPVEIAGRTAVLVDDGIATGASVRAACEVARERGARQIVIAVPVAPTDVEKAIGDVADMIVCLHTPERFEAVGEFYRDFAPVSDGEVLRLLTRGTG